MARTIRAFDSWYTEVNKYNPEKMKRDGSPRLTCYDGTDFVDFHSCKQLRRQLNKKERLNSRNELRRFTLK